MINTYASISPLIGYYTVVPTNTYKARVPWNGTFTFRLNQKMACKTVMA